MSPSAALPSRPASAQPVAGLVPSLEQWRFVGTDLPRRWPQPGSGAERTPRSAMRALGVLAVIAASLLLAVDLVVFTLLGWSSRPVVVELLSLPGREPVLALAAGVYLAARTSREWAAARRWWPLLVVTGVVVVALAALLVPTLGLVATSQVVVLATVEEVMFRGIAFDLLWRFARARGSRSGVATGLAVIGSCLLFAFQPGHIAQIGVAGAGLFALTGMAYGLARWFDDAFLPGIMLHAAANLAVLVTQLTPVGASFGFLVARPLVYVALLGWLLWQLRARVASRQLLADTQRPGPAGPVTIGQARSPATAV